MKYILSIFICIITFCNLNGQTTCSCQNDLKNLNQVVITNLILIKNSFITGSCVVTRRIYYNDSQGYEVEEEQLDCISKKRLSLKFSRDFDFYYPETPNENNSKKELRQKFLISIKYKQFFLIEINEKGEIQSIREKIIN